MYLVTLSDDDQPASHPFPKLSTALKYAEEVSRQLQDRVVGGRWDGADVRVWEAHNDATFGPTLDKMVARFVAGEEVPL